MMDADAFFEVLRSRRSVRSFADRKPDRTLIERLIEAACWAPSNHNRQGWKFVVFEDERMIGDLANECRRCVREAVASANRASQDSVGRASSPCGTGFQPVIETGKMPVPHLGLRTHSHGAAEAKVEELVHYAGAFDGAPVVILAMHKRSPAVGRTILETAAGPWASGEVLSTAMAVQNLCLAAHVIGLGTCVMTAPLLAGRVWAKLADSPAGFEPTCLVTLGYPAARPDAPRRKDLKHVVEYRARA